MKSIQIALLTAALAMGAEGDLPAIHGETASGKKIELPAAAAGKIALLVLGFSKHAGDRTGAWEDHAFKDFGSDPQFTTYSIAVLESVPGLMRGMVKAGIRSGTPEVKRDRMVTTVSGEAELKKFFDVTDTSVPYVLLLDGLGHTRWKGHGVFERGQYEALKAAVEELKRAK